ncbi:MAG TPA: GNAT family N-acetyltransferase [Polyangiaceae bacterium]|nr:GNAT family N-acetyltransferase [Polyangiaceae bacterium]
MVSTESVLLREATFADVPRLVELNHAAYPDLLVDGTVYDADQIRAHMACFPRGQIVAELGGRIVGAISTFIPSPSIPALKPHTWAGITDNGLFLRHDPAGRTLYLADVYVDPSVRRRGVGRTLYGGLFELCRSLELEHVVAGGRLWGYGDVAHRMTPEEYVAAVVRGELADAVLSSQLQAGFAVRGVLTNYLHDFRSRNFATLLEWVNPAHRTKGVSRAGESVRVASIERP